MEHLLIVKQGSGYKWACCAMPGGSCYEFTGMNIKVCDSCKLQRYKSVSKDNLEEFLIDEERGKILTAGIHEGVKKWLFCSHYRDTLWKWAGCIRDGGCCTDIYWSRDEGECLGCVHRATAILDHKGFTVGLNSQGIIEIERKK